MKGNLWHLGITIHKIYVGGDVGGLLFVIATIAAVLLGVPPICYFFAIAILAGIGIALILQQLHQ